MADSELTQLSMQIGVDDATEEELDRMTRHLLSEVRGMQVESAELTRSGPAPKGAKGDPLTVGSIAIQLLPAVLPSVIKLAQAWVSRGQGRTVKFKGEGFEFEGSLEDLQTLLEKLEKGRQQQ